MIASGCSARAIRGQWPAEPQAPADPRLSHKFDVLPMVRPHYCVAVAAASRLSRGKIRYTMQGPGFISFIPVLALATAACTSSLPTLAPPLQPAPQADKAERSQAPAEIVSIVPGSPTDVYALVARGALRCWFGANGPLKSTHVFHAEAESPAQGGAAEMVLHERDETLRDKRGARAFRVSFAGEPAGARVTIAMPRMEQQLALLMVKDVEAWAKGGTDCEVRKHMPSPQQPLTAVVGKGNSGAGKSR